MRKLVRALKARASATLDRGATAVVIAITMTLLLAGAAFSFDTANLTMQKQTLRNITDAAAQAGASYLKQNPNEVVNQVLAYAHMYDATLTPTVTLWCVVGSTGADKQIKAGFIPTTCNPGGSGTYKAGVGGVICDTQLCAIPCNLAGTNPVCNTVQVTSQKTVPYYFAPAIGINSGDTGVVTSVSCLGTCGTLQPNAMDIAFVADRTSSMKDSDFSAMRSAILNSLTTMTPEYQFVTFGTIHKSTTSGTCKTNISDADDSTAPKNGARAGTWMPLDFSNNYLTGTLGSTTRTLNTTSDLVSNITCTNQADQPWGTHLAAPLKAAARKLLGYDTTNNSLAAMTAARAKLLPDGATVTKAIILETDGVPEESIGFNGYLNGKNSTFYTDTNTSLGSTDINALDSSDPVSGSPWNGDIGCANLEKVADNAKALGITVITVGYGLANTAKCKKNYSNSTYSGDNVDDVLAASASNVGGTNGVASKANNDCSTTAGAKAENSDGDYYFCAASADQLSSIFSTAVAQLRNKTKFVKMPTT